MPENLDSAIGSPDSLGGGELLGRCGLGELGALFIRESWEEVGDTERADKIFTVLFVAEEPFHDLFGVLPARF
jgi:hypothetical protein